MFPISAPRHRRVFWGAQRSTSSGRTQHVDTQPPANAAGYTHGIPPKDTHVIDEEYLHVYIIHICGDWSRICCCRLHTCLVPSTIENIRV